MAICRTCLSFSVGEHSLDDVHADSNVRYSDMLAQCAGLVFDGDDSLDLPQALCASCSTELPAAYSFVVMCRASDARLRTPQPILKSEMKEEQFTQLKLEELKSEELSSDDIKSDGASSEDELLAEVLRTRRKVKKVRIKNDDASPNEETTCEECGHIAPNACRYKKHVKSQHPDLLHVLINYPCGACPKVFKRKSDMRVHERIHSGEKPFACEQCPQRFAQSGTLIEHRRHHTGETPFTCNVCHRSFSSRSSFWRHQRVHTRERPFACEICGKAFAHSTTLRTHGLVHSNARPHACRICGKATKSKYSLQQHLIIHSVKEFVCERCGKTFAIKSNLELHMRKMHGSDAGKCSVCSRDTSNLKRHMLRHSDTPLFRCDICAKAFRVKSALVFHLGFHNDATKYKCPIEGCEKAFPKHNMLVFHKRKQHSNETPHVCQYCEKGFFRVSDLTRHLHTAHPALI